MSNSLVQVTLGSMWMISQSLPMTEQWYQSRWFDEEIWPAPYIKNLLKICNNGGSPHDPRYIKGHIYISISVHYTFIHKPCVATIFQWEGTSSFNFVSSFPYYNYLRLVLVSASVLLIQWMEYIICAMHIYNIKFFIHKTLFSCT
jgi:hypothetical protein